MTRAAAESPPAPASGSDRAAAEPAEAPSPDLRRAHRPEAQVRPEIGGPKGPEPTRYGDWERNGRCSDF
jgi:hypothetical protein